MKFRHGKWAFGSVFVRFIGIGSILYECSVGFDSGAFSSVTVRVRIILFYFDYKCHFSQNSFDLVWFGRVYSGLVRDHLVLGSNLGTSWVIQFKSWSILLGLMMFYEDDARVLGFCAKIHKQWRKLSVRNKVLGCGDELGYASSRIPSLWITFQGELFAPHKYSPEIE